MINGSRNAEGYKDPTACTAVKNVAKGESSPFRHWVYICSPYRDDVQNNSLKAQYYCRFAVERGFLPVAPHLYFPQFLDDEKPEERETAMQMNSVLLGKCRELWIFGGEMSEGMQREYEQAKRQRKRIRYFTEDLIETKRMGGEQRAVYQGY